MIERAVTFATTFHNWRYALDLHLIEQTGRVFGDLPIPETVAAEWWAKGWTARDVAERLAVRARRIPKATAVRFFTDNPNRLVTHEDSNGRQRQV